MQLLSSPHTDVIVHEFHRTMSLIAMPLTPLPLKMFLPEGTAHAFTVHCFFLLWPSLPSGHASPCFLPTPPGAGMYAQRVAMLLLCWALLGWVFPTLLLLPMAKATNVRGSAASAPQAGVLDWLASAVERVLAELMLRQRDGANAHRGMSAVLSLLLHWWVLLVGLWCGCCLVVPMFVPPL